MHLIHIFTFTIIILMNHLMEKTFSDKSFSKQIVMTVDRN